MQSPDHALIELPKLSEHYSDETNLMCIVVNMTDHKRVELKTENGTFALNARGVLQYESHMSDATTVTFLKKSMIQEYFIIPMVSGMGTEIWMVLHL